MTIQVIGIMRYEFTDETSNKTLKGCKIQAIEPNARIDTNEFKGFKVIEYSGDESLLRTIRAEQMPQVYDASFTMKTVKDAKGKNVPTPYITVLTPCGDKLSNR